MDFSDWLYKGGIIGPALRGSGTQVQRELLKLGGKGKVDAFIGTLSSKFNNFEMEIPGPLPVR